MGRVFVAALLLAGLTGPATATAAQVVNLYSGRHYDGDQILYDAFTKKTGIKVNVLSAPSDEILQRLIIEGKRSPADVLITVDAGNLWRAETAGVLQPVISAVLTTRVPANLRDPKNYWFGLATRARVIIRRKGDASLANVKSYADLADPRYKGKVCVRRSSAIYNLSLLAAMIGHDGAAKAEAWARGVVANFARPPQGADTDQILSVGAVECALAIANHYYWLRLSKSSVAAQRDATAKTEIVFPDQAGRGTHVNISGAGVVATAPNKANAIKFLEFLVSDDAQTYFTRGNYEFPVVATASLDSDLKALGPFKTDPINVRAYGENQVQAQELFDKAGWK
jgi:iron(III) transport system substrate-binding protein